MFAASNRVSRDTLGPKIVDDVHLMVLECRGKDFSRSPADADVLSNDCDPDSFTRRWTYTGFETWIDLAQERTRIAFDLRTRDGPEARLVCIASTCVLCHFAKLRVASSEHRVPLSSASLVVLERADGTACRVEVWSSRRFRADARAGGVGPVAERPQDRLQPRTGSAVRSVRGVSDASIDGELAERTSAHAVGSQRRAVCRPWHDGRCGLPRHSALGDAGSASGLSSGALPDSATRQKTMAIVTRRHVAHFLRMVRRPRGYVTVEGLREDGLWSAAAGYAVTERLVLLHSEHAEEQEIHLTPAGEQFLHDWRWRWWPLLVTVASVILALDTLWSLRDRVAALLAC